MDNVVVCVDQTLNPAAISGAPCPSGQGLVIVQSQISSSSFDGVQASGFFTFGFGVVIFGYLLGFMVGQVRKPIRHAS